MQDLDLRTALSAISAGTTLAQTGTVVFGDAGGVSFGANGGTVTAVAPAQTAQPGIQSISAGTTRATTGEVVFADGGGVSFGMNGQTVTAVAPSQTTQPALQSLSAGTTRITTGEIVLSNSNGISFGANGQTVTASYTVPTQSVQTVGVYASSQTYGESSSSTLDARSLTIVGQGSLSVGLSGGSIILSASGGGGAGGSFSAGVSNLGNTAGTTGTVNNRLVLVGSNVVTMSQSTAAAGATVTVDALAIKAIAAGGTTFSTASKLWLTDTNGVSFGIATNGINSVITLTATVDTQYIHSIQAGGSTVTSARKLILADSNGVSFGVTDNALNQAATVTATVDTQYIHSIQAGGSTLTTGRKLVFVDSNGVSFGLTDNPINLAGSITATVDTQYIHSVVAGTATVVTARRISFLNSNGISWGGSENIGNSCITITASLDATAAGAGTGDVGGIAAGTQTATSGTIAFLDSNGISFGMSGSTRVTASYIPFGVSAGTQSVSTGTVVFSDSNGVTFGLSGSSRLTMSFLAVKSISAGTTRATADEVVFSNSNGVSFGASGNTITATVTPGAAAGIAAIEAGTQTQTSGTASFADSNGISFGMSGSSRITASAWAVSEYPFGSVYALIASSLFAGSTATTAGGSQTTISMYLAPMVVPVNIVYDRIVGIVSGQTPAGTGSNTQAHMLGVYTVNGGTALSLLSTFAFGMFFTQSSSTAVSGHYFWGSQSSTHSSATTGNATLFQSDRRISFIDDPNGSGTQTITMGHYVVAYCYTKKISSTDVVQINSHYCYTGSNQTKMAVPALGVAPASVGSPPPVQFIGIASSAVSSTAADVFNLFPSSINVNGDITGAAATQQRYPFLQLCRNLQT